MSAARRFWTLLKKTPVTTIRTCLGIWLLPQHARQLLAFGAYATEDAHVHKFRISEEDMHDLEEWLAEEEGEPADE